MFEIVITKKLLSNLLSVTILYAMIHIVDDIVGSSEYDTFFMIN